MALMCNQGLLNIKSKNFAVTIDGISLTKRSTWITI